MADRTCSIDGCERPNRQRGWCYKHHRQWTRHGDPMAPIVKPSLTDTFWAHVDKNGPVSRLGTQCWNWTRSTGSHGYGELRHKGRLILVHRLSYALANGVEASGLVDHQCHNPLCVNPEHLRSVTKKQNGENRSGLPTNNTSGVLGVGWCKRRRRWRGNVGHNGKFIHVGYFDSRADAEAAVVAKRNELFTHNELDRVVA